MLTPSNLVIGVADIDWESRDAGWALGSVLDHSEGSAGSYSGPVFGFCSIIYIYLQKQFFILADWMQQKNRLIHNVEEINIDRKGKDIWKYHCFH